MHIWTNDKEMMADLRMPITETIRSGYDPKTTETYRTPRDLAEMISWCESHAHIHFRDRRGMARIAKVNGKVRTWKRDPDRVEIPLKYGLYEYFTFTASDIGDVLIPLESQWKSEVVA